MRYHTLTEQLLRESCRKAREMGHSYVDSFHILLELIRGELAAQVAQVLFEG